MNQLLRTKLYVPAPGPNVVARPRLIERLHAGLQRKLTLIAAPAGFGKSTLVSEWVATGQRPTAWLSLDAADNDPIRFLAYFVAAVQTIAPTIGQGVMQVLQAPQPPQDPAGRAALLTALLNEITTLPDPFLLVLDDYHVIDAALSGQSPLGAVDQLLTFLIEHLPPQLHLVIATREDPPLPLARLRARGQLTEVRAADLRFTPPEAADFLNRVMGLNLAVADIAALEERTEGWIAGLQLAALSMQGRQDVAGFVRAFAGDNRYIVDYLMEEVLQRQPDAVRNFLLHTAILERLNGPLCDAVTGQPGGKARLETLQRGNFFLIPLDDTRHWYRYHHLFADVLLMHLLTEQPDQLPALHRRACAWYEQHGALADAIRHALAGQDFEHAADLIERAVPDMRRSRQEVTLLAWLKALPDAVVRVRPVLSAVYAGALMQSGELQGVEMRIQDAERWLATPADKDERAHMVVIDQEEFRRLPGWIAIYRAGLALVQGNVPNTLQYARRARDLVLEDDQLGHGAAAALLGLACWASGQLEAAHHSYAAGMAHLLRAGFISDAVGGALALADIRIVQGRLRQAMRIYEQALQLATEQPPAGPQPVLRGTADMYVGMSELYRERNDLEAARQALLHSQALGEHIGFPQHPYRWRVAMARLREAQGDLDGALALLDEAARLYVSDFYPNVRPIAALKARVWVAQGRVDEALDWAHEQDLSVHDELSYVREFEHITLARVLLAHDQRDRAGHTLPAAMGLLDRLLQAADAGDQGVPRTRSVIEILVLQALAHQLRGDRPAALARLERALTQAEPEGYVRLFVDEGEALHLLLVAFHARLATAPNPKLAAYTDKLIASFGHAPSSVDNPLFDDQSNVADAKLPLAGAQRARQPLIEPLSERELDVLRLLRTDLSGPEIARHLMISLNTLRTHTKNIYAKLGVNHRRAAARRAEELELSA
jgi:LuxR family maltose regulon positive regulatory protein